MNAIDIYDNKDNIIPIIGENCFFYYSEDGTKIPLQDYLIDKIIERSKIKHPEDLPIEQMKKKGFFGLSLCRQQCGFSGDEEYIKCYRNIIREAKQRIHLDKTIKDFLAQYSFHVIITTCCFEFIEGELPGYTSKSYIAAKGGNNNEDIDPGDYIIYHIFGKCDNASKWAWDEESLIYILHCHHDNDCASNGLHRYIFPDLNSGNKSKSLLILYSNLPDWLFRFFLYPLAYKEKWSGGFYLNKNEQDSSLKNFIERVICYDVEDNEIDQLLNEAKDMITPKEQDLSKRVNHNEEFDIFLSHANEDDTIAIKIKEILEKQHGLKVWLDNKGGIEDGSYSKKIKDAIQHSAYFMPLITESYVGKLKNHVYNTIVVQCDEKENDEEFENKIDTIIQDILKDDDQTAYVQKEAWAASFHWRIIEKSHPHREAYVLPILFEGTSKDKGGAYNIIKACVGLGQLPENIFKEQSIKTYSKKLFVGGDWSRYKTIEK